MARGDTLPKILKLQNERYGDKKVAMRKKHLGIWKEYTWKDVYENVKSVSLGLVSLGLMRGDNIAIIGDSDPQWYWAEYAAQAAGGTATGIYVDARSRELLHFIKDCDAKFAFVKGQEQVDNISEIKDQLPRLKKIFYWVGMGLQQYRDPLLMTYKELQDLGTICEKKHPGLFENNIRRGKEEEEAVICYTQGTAGALPKGIALSHKYLIKNCDLWFRYDPWSDTGILVSYVPPISALDQILGVAGVLIAAVEVGFPEEPDTFNNDIREMGPHYFYSGASFWEGLVSSIQVNMNKASYLKKALYDFFLPIGYEVADLHFLGKKPALIQRFAWVLANLLVFRPLRNNLGLSRIRSAYQGGAFLSPDCIRFLHAIGVNLKQTYALAESGLITMHRAGDMKAATVGPPVEEGTIRISENGEILFRSDQRPIGQYKHSDADNEVADVQGWIHTGDVGFLDKDGNLIILGSRNEILCSKKGNLVSPESIEAKLRFSPYIKHAMLIGGNERDFVSAIICISYENVGEWAKSHHITYATFLDLSQTTQAYDLVQEALVQVNKDLPGDTKIRTFLNLHKELDADDGELTRTGKLRRKFMEEHYKDIIDAIYKGKEEYLAETEVRYRDGRIGIVKKGIQIRSLGA